MTARAPTEGHPIIPIEDVDVLPRSFVDEGEKLVVEALAVACHVEGLVDRVKTLSGAVTLLHTGHRRPGETLGDADARSQAACRACRLDDLYEIVTAIAGKATSYLGADPDDEDGAWTWTTLYRLYDVELADRPGMKPVTGW